MSPGKLVRYTVADGGEVAADQPYAEVEVMKMFMPLLAPAAGAPPCARSTGHLPCRLHLVST